MSRDYQLAAIASPARYDDLHPRIRRRGARLGPPLLPPLRLGDERQLVPLGRVRERQRPGAVTSPPGATCTTSSPRLAPPTSTWVWCPYADVDRASAPSPATTRATNTSTGPASTASTGPTTDVNSQPWRSFDEIFWSSYRPITRKIAPTKPMLLAEFASGGKSHRKSEWIKQMFQDLRTKYRRIRGLIWFEQFDRGVQWPIESAPKVTEHLPPRNQLPGLHAERLQHPWRWGDPPPT